MAGTVAQQKDNLNPFSNQILVKQQSIIAPKCHCRLKTTHYKPTPQADYSLRRKPELAIL